MMRYIPGSMMKVQRTTNSVYIYYSSNRTYDTYCVYSFIDTVVICTMTALVIIIFNGDNTVFNYGGEGGVVINGVASEGARHACGG